MNALLTVIVVVQVLTALAVIGLVLVQHGKGADMGAAFGSGASGSLFGATGSSNFLSKATGVAATIFFGATLALAFIGNKSPTASGGVMENFSVAPGSVAPTAPSAAVPGATSAPADATVTPGGAPSGAAGQANQIPK